MINTLILKSIYSSDVIDVSWTACSSSNDIDELKKGDKSEYVTSLLFILPLHKKIEEGNFQIKYKEETISINVSKIQDKSQNPIYSGIKPLHYFHLGFKNVGTVSIPCYIISDNKGKYPCFCVKLIFPYRLANWLDKSKIDDDELIVIGPPYNEDKINALIILNRLFKNKILNITYEDVTVFSESYFMKKDGKHFLTRLNFFTSRYAFRDAISEYYFGCKFSEIPLKQSIKEIINEEDLSKEIMDAIDSIKHHIENRHWTDPFWDNSNPKIETEIQPTLHVLFDIILDPFGITVVRETDEGVGNLDFRFIYTTKEKNAISVSAEFKLAHNMKIKHGLTIQLPAYLLANKSKSGIFVVMWFKDETGKHFKKPKKYSKSGLINYLENTSKTLYEDKEFKIKTILIDASIRSPASKL